MSQRSWSSSFAAAAASAMQVYEDALVGPLFTPWGRLLCDALALSPSPGEAVADIACGPGSVTVLAASAVGPGGRVVGMDISAGMLEIARAKPPVDGAAPIEYLEAPAEALPVPDESFDVVLCQQGLQFFPDKPAALAEMRRILRPGGRLGVAVWASIDQTPPFEALMRAVEDVGGTEMATTYRNGPWGFPSADALLAVVREAGFSDVELTTRELPLVFPGGADQLIATLAFSAIAQALGGPESEAFARLAERAREHLAPFESGGEIRSFARANVVLAKS